MAWLFSDENFPLPVVEELRRLGHDVQTIQDVGQASQQLPDESVLSIAVADQRAVLTLNRRHFIRLHQQSPEHAGIIVCTYDSDFVGQTLRIHQNIESYESLTGRLIRVNRVQA